MDGTDTATLPCDKNGTATNWAKVSEMLAEEIGDPIKRLQIELAISDYGLSRAWDGIDELDRCRARQRAEKAQVSGDDPDALDRVSERR